MHPWVMLVTTLIAVTVFGQTRILATADAFHTTKVSSNSLPLRSQTVGRIAAVSAVSAKVGTSKVVANEEGIGLAPSIVNLVKNICGAGVLSLPAGLAALSNSKGAIIPGCVMVLCMGVISAYCFVLIGRVCEMTKKPTYKGAVTEAMGETWGQVLAVATLMKTFAASLMGSIIIGDTVASLAATFGAPQFLTQRWKLLALSTASLLAPLCLLRSFAVLSYTSMLGIAGTLYTGVFMGIRLFDGSYAPGGKFFKDLIVAAAAAKKAPLLPAFGSTTDLASIFYLLSMLSSVFYSQSDCLRTI